ncbi:EamA family transporter [Candidatus Woesearchaeota archaeon]|nr:EamA family transporter [Candidatus Woesearchaeota archaeon]
MIWVLFALLTALFEALKDVFSKKSLQKVDEFIVALAFRLYALPIIIPLMFFFPFPSLNAKFWTVLIIGGSIATVASILFMKSLKYADLSVSIPMLTFTPLFLLITSPLINGEFPTFTGLIGILLIVIGSYALNIKELKHGLFAPFKALVKKKGPRYMLFVAFIWSINSNLDKIGIQNSSPYFWAFGMYTFLTLAALPIAFIMSRKHLHQLKTHWKELALVGTTGAIRIIFQYLAISLTLVAYVISIKRFSAVLSVILGFFIFKEMGIKERLVGASLMVAGVLFIILL